MSLGNSKTVWAGARVGLLPWGRGAQDRLPSLRLRRGLRGCVACGPRILRSRGQGSWLRGGRDLLAGFSIALVRLLAGLSVQLAIAADSGWLGLRSLMKNVYMIFIKMRVWGFRQVLNHGRVSRTLDSNEKRLAVLQKKGVFERGDPFLGLIRLHVRLELQTEMPSGAVRPRRLLSV